jgi:hypothetical protein
LFALHSIDKATKTIENEINSNSAYDRAYFYFSLQNNPEMNPGRNDGEKLILSS